MKHHLALILCLAASGCGGGANSRPAGIGDNPRNALLAMIQGQDKPQAVQTLAHLGPAVGEGDAVEGDGYVLLSHG